jgi:hypothetical protein
MCMPFAQHQPSYYSHRGSMHAAVFFVRVVHNIRHNGVLLCTPRLQNTERSLSSWQMPLLRGVSPFVTAKCMYLEKISSQEIRCIVFWTYILKRNHNIDSLCANFFTLCMSSASIAKKGVSLHSVMKIRRSYICELLLKRVCVTQLIRLKCSLYHSLRPPKSQHPSD